MIITLFKFSSAYVAATKDMIFLIIYIKTLIDITE